MSLRQERSGRHAPPDLTISVGEGRTAIEMQALPQGSDWILRITGGDDHIGAVAVAEGGAVRCDVIGIHKEGPLAETCARRWAEVTGSVCVAVAGIHQDDITKDEIAAILRHVEQGLELLIQRWKEARS